jgi:hypothetical protein
LKEPDLSPKKKIEARFRPLGCSAKISLSNSSFLISRSISLTPIPAHNQSDLDLPPPPPPAKGRIRIISQCQMTDDTELVLYWVAKLLGKGHPDRQIIPFSRQGRPLMR